MSKQTINIGASPNDGTGTPLRTSFDFTNQNFTELYNALGGGVGLPGATTQVIFNDGGTNLAGDAGLVYNKTTDALTVGGLVTAGSATISGALTVDTTTLVVDSTNDRVGIGVSPATKLHIAGIGTQILRVQTNTSGDPTLNLTAAGADGCQILFDRTNNYLRFDVSSVTGALIVNTSGNVGIGTFTPDIFGRFYTRSIGFNSSGSTGLQINGNGFGAIDLGAAGVRTFGITSSATDANISTITNIPMIFNINGATKMTLNTAGNLAFPSAKGIDFSAVTGGTGTATANVLNDYEEGTWVPTVGGTSTYTANQKASYIKVGRLVTVSFDMEINLIGTGNTVSILGLPFVVGNVNHPKNEQCNGAAGYFQSLAVNVFSITFNAAANTSVINSISMNTLGGTANVNPPIYGNGTRVQGTVTYMAA